MRRNVDIAKLTEFGKQVEFPVEDRKFRSFSFRLRELAEENFGRAARSLEYSSDDQTFFWSEEESCGFFKDGGGCVSITKTFTINPRASLADEFTRIDAQRKAFLDRARAVMRAVHRMMGSDEI